MLNTIIMSKKCEVIATVLSGLHTGRNSKEISDFDDINSIQFQFEEAVTLSDVPTPVRRKYKVCKYRTKLPISGILLSLAIL